MLAYPAAEEKVVRKCYRDRKLHILLVQIVPRMREKRITLYQMDLCTKRFWFMLVAPMEVEPKKSYKFCARFPVAKFADYWSVIAGVTGMLR